MVRHFFIDKTNTIIEGSEQNLGLNPILQLAYGQGLMKGLLHFDVSPIRALVNDGTFSDTGKLKFTLKMTNCMSVDGFPYEKELIRGLNRNAMRASSFDLILYKLPLHWDAGRGFDYVSDFWIHDRRSFSRDGSNWYCCRTGMLWDKRVLPPSLKDVTGGIYTYDEIYSEYENYRYGKESIIVGMQHFDFGNENLAIDITDYVLEVLDSETDINYGLCLSFTPEYDIMETEIAQYVGFFNDNTNTFFHPYVECIYDEYISDDRESFTYGQDNNLYLYVSDNGLPVNLDNIPSCCVNGEDVEVFHATKGVYRAHIPSSAVSLTPETILTDVWSGISINGVPEDNVEMEFFVNPKERKTSIGMNSEMRRDMVPSVYGINDAESISRGETREVSVDFRVKYNTEKKILIDGAEYRIYVMDGNRELDVIDYQPVEKTFLNNFFIIYTEDLIPHEYFVDIKVKMGRETKFYKKILKFRVVDNVTERYQ